MLQQLVGSDLSQTTQPSAAPQTSKQWNEMGSISTHRSSTGKAIKYFLHFSLLLLPLSLSQHATLASVSSSVRRANWSKQNSPECQTAEGRQPKWSQPWRLHELRPGALPTNTTAHTAALCARPGLATSHPIYGQGPTTLASPGGWLKWNVLRPLPTESESHLNKTFRWSCAHWSLRSSLPLPCQADCGCLAKEPFPLQSSIHHWPDCQWPPHWRPQWLLPWVKLCPSKGYVQARYSGSCL